MSKLHRQLVWNKLGKAAELIVRAKLLLLGYTPSSPDVDDGTDVILKNGLRIGVKSALPFYYKGGSPSWKIALKSGHDNKKLSKDDVDILICVLFEKNKEINSLSFFIIPFNKIKATHTISLYKNSTTSKYYKFKNAWDLL